jgi:hypothetical protein
MLTVALAFHLSHTMNRMASSCRITTSSSWVISNCDESESQLSRLTIGASRFSRTLPLQVSQANLSNSPRFFCSASISACLNSLFLAALSRHSPRTARTVSSPFTMTKLSASARLSAVLRVDDTHRPIADARRCVSRCSKTASWRDLRDMTRVVQVLRALLRRR